MPQKSKRRLDNAGIIPLMIIEVQNSSYLGEDDVVRFEDIYGQENVDGAVEIEGGM